MFCLNLLTKWWIYDIIASSNFEVFLNREDFVLPKSSKKEMFMNHRHYAHPLDKTVDGPAEEHGVGPNRNAIGGCEGIGWYEYFEDRQTREVYRVHCSDGVNGGKDPHSPQATRWLNEQYRFIIDRTQKEARSGQHEIVKISNDEWSIMSRFTHAAWFDPEPYKKYAKDADKNLKKGKIGTINGVPIVIDPEMKSPLSTPPE